MLTYTYIWSVDPNNKFVKITVFEQENSGPTLTVSENTLNLADFDTEAKVLVEAASYAGQIRDKRAAEVVAAAAQSALSAIADTLRAVEPGSPITLT